jgi:hypothetical protein
MSGHDNSPLLGPLLAHLPEIFHHEVLPLLDPADRAFLAQAGRGCRAAVMASDLPCAGTRVGMREMNAADRDRLAQAVRAADLDYAPDGNTLPHPAGSQLESLGFVEISALPRALGVVRLELRDYSTSAGRLSLAKVGRCMLTVSKRVLKAPTVPALEAII